MITSLDFVHMLRDAISLRKPFIFIYGFLCGITLSLIIVNLNTVIIDTGYQITLVIVGFIVNFLLSIFFKIPLKTTLRNVNGSAVTTSSPIIHRTLECRPDGTSITTYLSVGGEGPSNTKPN